MGSQPPPPMPHVRTQFGGDPTLAAEEMLHTIAESIKRQPRSLQKRIGPSEIGQACTRRLGYKLLGVAEKERPPAWKPTIGTAVHSHLESVFDAYNVAHLDDGQERYAIETTLTVGKLGDTPITGTADIYDRITGTNWDWKVVGPTQLKKYRASGPGEQYRTQAHLYGQGWWNAGHVCTHVGVIFLPRNGELSDAHIWCEKFDPVVARDALDRLNRVHDAIAADGAGALEDMPTSDDWCRYCPWFASGSTDLAAGCPGHPAATVNQPDQTQLVGLLG